MTDHLVPPGGFSPFDFPQMTLVPIPYTSNPNLRPDPYMRIQDDGWMFIEAGPIRVAFPDKEEWLKFIDMGNRLWNTWDVEHQELPHQTLPPGDGIAEQENTTHDSVDESEQCGPSPATSVGQ